MGRNPPRRPNVAHYLLDEPGVGRVLQGCTKVRLRENVAPTRLDRMMQVQT